MNAIPALSQERFIFDVKKIIDLNFSDPDFDVNLLCRKIGKSRSHLHRLLTLNGKKCGIELLHEARLNKASELLQNTGLAIKEIAFACGFNCPNYFSKIFTLKIGYSPKYYRQQCWSERAQRSISKFRIQKKTKV